jgi:hypothetical protein
VQYDACHLCKETRKPFSSNKQRRSTKPGEMVHADLSGKMQMKSLGGASYFLLLKDDATGFRHTFFLKNKSDAAANVISFLKLIKNQTSTNVKTLQTDNGTEFVCKELVEFLADEGIIHETSAPHCLESNGKIEREMRTIKDLARAMLNYKNTPDFLWTEAMNTAVYTQNRLLNSQSPDKTAFEKIFNRKPNLANIRTFGSKAFVQVPKETRKVWEPKAKIGMLVGYDNLSL